MNLLVDAAGDIVITNGATQWVTGPVEIAAKLNARYRMFLGEWFLNTAEGVPYFERILGSKDTLVAEEILKSVAVRCPGVVKVEKFVAAIDLQTRQFSISFRAFTDDGPFDFDVDFTVG